MLGDYISNICCFTKSLEFDIIKVNGNDELRSDLAYVQMVENDLMNAYLNNLYRMVSFTIYV